MRLQKFYLDEIQLDKAKDILSDIRAEAYSESLDEFCDDLDDLLFEIEQQRINPVKRKSDANFELEKKFVENY